MAEDNVSDDDFQYAVIVGVQCYGLHNDAATAETRAKYWAEKRPEATVYVQARKVIWSNGVGFRHVIPTREDHEVD